MNSIHLFHGEAYELYEREFINYLSLDEQITASNKVLELDRITFVTCRYFLKSLLSFKLNKPIEEVRFNYSVNGKPYLQNENLHFNVSHTQGRFVIAITSVGMIGVDIELKSRKFEICKLSSMLFSNAEQNAFYELSEKDKNVAFIKSWTRKEAFFKAKGSGLSSPLKELEFEINNFEAPEILNTKWDPAEQKEWTVKDIRISNDVVGAVAVKGKIITQLVQNLNKFEGVQYHDVLAL